MKRLTFIIISALIYSNGFAQTATSVANGNWLNPLTWSCFCIPVPGYTVTINHAVSLDTSFYAPSGGITINAGGALIENNPTRDIWVNGGSLVNNGTLTIRYLWMQAGAFGNSGTATMRSFLNYVNFTNTGVITTVDSIYTTADITNNGSFINIDSITNGGTFINNGLYTGNQFTNTGTYTNNNLFTFTDITNNGTLINADTITNLHSSWNRGVWNNLAGAYFQVSSSFLNGDTASGINAAFINNGKVSIGSSWYNIDTTRGTTGSFVVADTTINWGWMKGTFDFCDLTPPASAPFVDFNLGTIEAGITWCTNSGIKEMFGENSNVFPSPASGNIHINAGGLKNYEVNVYTSQGVNVGTYRNISSLDISNLAEGLYFISIVSDGIIMIKKVQIIKK